MKVLVLSLCLFASPVFLFAQVENVNGHALAMYPTQAEALAASDSLPNVRAVIPLTGTDGSFKWVTYAVVYQPLVSSPPECYETDAPADDPQVQLNFSSGVGCSSGLHEPRTASFATRELAKAFILSLSAKQQLTASMRFMPGNQASPTYLWFVSYQAQTVACI
jgi:hypothetical protein